MAAIKDFITHHYRHFNAAVVIDAAQAYVDHLAAGGKMFVTLAGAMSTAELGLSLAEMIRQDKVHGICCTGANLEEDIFNLVAHDHYVRVPHYRDLSPAGRGDAARARPQPRHRHLHPRRRGDAAHRAPDARRCGRRHGRGQALLPARVHVPAHRERRAAGVLPDRPQGLAGCWPRAEKKLPIFVPGWEDSTLGNIFVAAAHARRRRRTACVKYRHRATWATWSSGTRARRRDAVARLLPDRRRHRRRLPDLRRAADPAGPRAGLPLWGYFCQISRLDHVLRLVLRRRAEREDHLGQARRRHADASSSSPTRRSSRR